MCEKCSDTGYLHGVENTQTGQVIKVSSARTPGDIEREYRYPVWIHFIQECPCKVNLELTQLWNETAKKIPQDVKNHTLADFATMPHASDAVAIAEIMIAGDEVEINGHTKPGLLLTGGTGTGKSSLAYILFKHYSARGVSCAWCNYNDLINRIRETYADNYQGDSMAAIVAPYGKAQVLFLDDLGSETRQTIMAEDAIEAMRLLFEARYNKRLITVITTNLNAESQLRQQFGDRVWSRMIGLCHVAEMNGVDLRIKV